MFDSKEDFIDKKRGKARDAQAKESMREKISFTKTLKSIDDSELLLLSMINDDDLSSAKVGAVNALLGSKWKKMNKLLPDIKAIEITGENGEPIKTVSQVNFMPVSSKK